MKRARRQRAVRLAAGALALVGAGASFLLACNAIIDGHDLFLVDGAEGGRSTGISGDGSTPLGVGDTGSGTTDTGATRGIDAATLDADAGAGTDGALDAMADADPDLLAYYTFDEDGGPLAHDKTGHGNDLLLMSGATVGAQGHDGPGGLQFASYNSVAACDSLSDTSFPQAGTLSFWAYFPLPDGGDGYRRLFDDYDETRRHIFVRYSGGNTDGSTFGLDFAEQIGMGFTFFAAPRPTIPVKVWTHIVLVWDETADAPHAQFYEDGMIPAQADDAFPAGALDGKFALYNGWEGTLDDVYLWKRAFTPLEVNAIP